MFEVNVISGVVEGGLKIFHAPRRGGENLVCAWIVPLPLKRDSAVGRVLAGPRGVVFMLVEFR